MSAPTDAQALLAWMDDAHYAVEMGHALSPVMIMALAATPTHAAASVGAVPTLARTWFLEEYERVAKAQMRDPVPFSGTDADIQRWRERQAMRSDDLAQLLHQHAQCLIAARAFVSGRPVSRLRPAPGAAGGKKGKARPTRRTAARVALDALGEDAA